MASATELRAIRKHKQTSYPVRSRFVDDDGEPRFINQLVAAVSPYLLQHAHNPVHWYPWGRDAFDRATAENKPIFLSIGYSTCHWCHVMEEECFDDIEVAQALNRSFISIKIDRERRPDLDAHYMTAVQLTNGQGGWPMSCFLTPDGKPFFGATYIPKAQFLHLLDQVQQVWQTQPERLHSDADRIDQAIREQLAPPAAAKLPADLGERAVAALIEYADTTHGGFGTAPKFPQEPNLMLLAEHAARDPRPQAEQPAWPVLRGALDAMQAGGIHDPIGGGFHRYATDAAWLVPHFEKMLYNQGQLAAIYLCAWQLSGEPTYRRVVESTLDYVIREMQSPQGGFYSATDADSEGVEGRYFVWSYDELTAVLDADELAFCKTVFGVTRHGNFEGANILHQPQSLAESADPLGLSPAAFDARLQTVRQHLYDCREQRAHPLRDDKHITEWNGMVIVALARAAQALGRDDYRSAARQAAGYLWRIHYDATQNVLWRTSLDGAASAAGQIEDYAHLMAGFIAVYDATGDDSWLTRAQTLLSLARTRHWDDAAGGFFGPPAQSDEPQPMRSKTLMDNATVSGNSLLPSVLQALHERTGAPELRTLADKQIAAFSGHIAHMPLAGPVFLTGLWQWQTPTPGPLQYLGAGAIRAEASLEESATGAYRMLLSLTIRDGWHIQPLGDDPEATRLRLINADANPDAGTVQAQVKTSQSTLDNAAILTGRVTLSLESGLPATEPWIAELSVQPCTERECLAVETRRFVLHSSAHP